MQTSGAGAFAAADLDVTNGSATLAGTTNPLVWTATVTPNTGVTGNVLVDLPKDRVRDRAGNGNTAATQLSVPVDTEAPTVVSIERHDGTSAQAEHTNADSLTFRVTFSEDVANVNAADFDASGTDGDATGVADVTGNDAQVIVTVSGGNLDDYDGDGRPHLRFGPEHHRHRGQRARQHRAERGRPDLHRRQHRPDGNTGARRRREHDPERDVRRDGHVHRGERAPDVRRRGIRRG